MRQWVWSAAVGALAAVAAVGADDKPKPADTPAASVAALKKEAQAAEQELYKKLDALGEDKEGQKKAGELFEAHEKEQAKRYEAALAAAKADPKSDAAFEAIDWLLTTPRVYYVAAGRPAFELAAEHFAGHPKIGRVVGMVGRFGPQEGTDAGKAAAAFLKAVEEKNTDRSVRAQLALVKASKAKGRYEVAEYRGQKDADELATVAEKAFEAAVKEFGEVKLSSGRGGGQTVAELAKPELFELQTLRVGKPAPEIEGEDLDGKKFKLSDYKGKVVLLDFWGDW